MVGAPTAPRVGVVHRQHRTLMQRCGCYNNGMPPSTQSPFDPTDLPAQAGHLLPQGHPDRARKSSAGPVAGTIIIIVLLIIGALYFWGAHVNQQKNLPPYIPADTSTTTIGY